MSGSNNPCPKSVAAVGLRVGWVVGWGNGLILGYLMYRSGLVPRKMAWLGLVGGPLIIISGRSSCSQSATLAARCKVS